MPMCFYVIFLTKNISKNNEYVLCLQINPHKKIHSNCIITMSSWKSYGGINNFDKRGSINADSLTVNNMTLKHTYKGNFDICGQMNIDGGITVTKDVDISGSLVVSDNTTLGSSSSGSTLTVLATSVFEGPAQFNDSFSTVGNIVSIQNLIATKNVIVGNSIYFTNGNINNNTGPFIFGNGSYIGINTFNPNAALDISTNLVRGFNIKSYNNTNENIIAQNSVGYGVSVGADLSSSNIYFYAEHNPYSGVSDGQISYLPGGYLNIDVSKNVNVLSPMTLSMNPTIAHNHGEMLSVYDISSGVYFGNIYMNPNAYTGPAASFIADSSNSNTFVYVGTPGGLGGAIGGGSYPGLINRGMTTVGVTDTSGNYTPAQTIVSGNVLSRYYTTTGVNTFKPRIDNYVLDVNGPIHVDNGDIVDSTGSIPFELYYISRAKDNYNVVAALGSSIDIYGDDYLSNNPLAQPRERVIYTVDGGKKWLYIDISNEIGLSSNILKGNTLTGIHLYNSNQWFITGYNSQLITTFDGGISWQNINTPITGGLNFNNIYINKTPNSINGNLIGYFTDNQQPNKLYIFDISAGVFNNLTDNINIAGNTTIIGNVSSIKADTNTLYVTGNGIATYNITPTVQKIPSAKYVWNTNYFYNQIKVYDNSYAIAVGGNIISSTTNGGATWKDTMFNGIPGFTSVHLIDSQNAITVGSQGNIWLSSNRGNTWYPMPLNLINSSGKAGWLLSSNLFRNVTMVDNNTILLSNTIQGYKYGSAGSTGIYGKSNIFSLFAPNLVNAANNYVLDISGTVRISGGDIQINDGGSIVSNNSTLNIANTDVQTIYLGGAATNIVIGSTLGNTTINNNINISGTTTFNGNNVLTGAFSITNTAPSTAVGNGALVVSGGAGIGGNLNVGGFSHFTNDVSFNGILVVNNSTVSNNKQSGAVVINGGVGIEGNLNIGGSLGVTTDLNLPGNITVKQITITSGNLLSTTGQLNLSTLTKPSVDKNTGAVIVGGGVGIGGNLNVGGLSNITGDTSIGGRVSITNQTLSTSVNTGALTVAGGVGIGQSINVGGSVTSYDVVVTSGDIKSTNNSLNIKGPTGIPTVYTIGNDGDTIQLKGTVYGTVKGNSISQSVSNNPTILVNNKGGNAIATRAGIDIVDNSGANALSNDPYCQDPTKNTFAYIHVGDDLQSYVFKAPSFGSTSISAPITQISKENRLRIGVNELNLWDISNNVRRGLVILQPDTDFKNYQTSKGHQYGPYTDADYAINVCPDFDISNIMLKNVDSIAGTQTIGTNVSVLGNVTTNGNLFVTNSMSVSGTGLFFGNVGIGTSAPLSGLDVSGSSRFVGPLISTNYDTLRFSNNYGYGWQDKSNTVIDSSYYQDVASSYDGKYQYALVYNKNGFGSVNVSSNSGASWSNVPLPSSYAGNIIYQAVPFMITATGSGTTYSQTYRFQDLAGNISLPNAIPLNIQVGTYIASASSVFGVQYPYYVFDNSISTYWNPTSTSSYPTNETPITSGFLTIDSNNIENVYGEYVQIFLPYSFILKNYQHYPLPGTNYSKLIYVFGSSNGYNWFNLTINGNIINNNPSVNSGNTYVSITNNTSYNFYRFVISSVYSGVTNPQITRIDLSGIFQNTTGSFSSSIAASGTGQYTTVANQGYYPGTGNLFISSNYGQVGSWTDTNQQAIAVWQSISMSQTGKIQAAIGINRSGSGNIYLSTNYGQPGTWNPVTQLINTTNGWQTISMSSTGQYITAIQASSISSGQKGNIWVSADYGSTWSSNYSIFNYTQTVNGFLNLGTADFNKTVCVSSSGQYQTALGLAPTSDLTSNANIWTSSDYGLTWSDTGYRAPAISGASSILTSISMTGSGLNQVVSYVGGNTGASQPSTTVYGNILVSSNYGASWTDTNFKAPTEHLNGNTYYGFVSKVQSTVNGQYVVGVSKYADISGNTYNNNNSTVGGVGNVFISSVPTSTNLLINQYLGSPYTNGVNETHGIQLSVPTVNNASLMMGYDINYDSGYINSGDQNGANSLGINTNGGFVGIGKIAPTAALDVSGNLIVSGGLTIGGTTNFSANSTFNTIGVTSTTGSINSSTGALHVVGGVGIGGNLNVGGFSNFVLDSSFNGNLLITSSTGSTSKGSGALRVVGGVGVGGNLNVGGFSNFVLDSSFNGNLLITSSTSSTDKNSGALRVVGGVGVGGNLNVGGFSNFVLDSSFNGNVVVNKNIITYGNIGIKTNVTSQYALNVDGSANITSLYIGGTKVNFNPTGQWTTSGNNIYYTAGVVGIGTNNPAYTLDVSGTINIKNNSSYTNYQRISISNPLILGSHTATLNTTPGSFCPIFSFITDVGNGSSLNAYQYRHSSGSGWGTASTRIQQTIDNTNQAYLEFNPPNSMSGVGLYGSSSGTFGTGSGITVNGSGKVGIGTTNPQYTLDICGNSVGNGSTPMTQYNINSVFNASSPTSANEIGSGIRLTCPDTNKTSLYGGEVVGYINPGASHGLKFNTYSNGTVTERMRLAVIGGTACTIGIGTNNPQYALDVNGSIRLNNASSTNNKLLILYDPASGDPLSTATNFYGFGINSSMLRYQAILSASHTFFAGTTKVFNIAYNGDITASSYSGSGVPPSTMSQGFCIGWNFSSSIGSGQGETNFFNQRGVGSGGFHFYDISNGAPASINNRTVTFSQTGQISATSFNATSDYRIKTDIIKLTDISYNIDQLNPVKYTNTKLGKDDMGFIAHEVQEIFPFLVTGVKDGEEKQTLNYNGFIALLVKEVQDLKKENIDLKTRLDAIEKRLM